MLCYTHESYEGHVMGEDHPESPERLAVLRRRFLERGLFERMTLAECVECDEEDLLSVHTKRRVNLIRRACEEARRDGWAGIDGDTSVSAGSWEAAVRAVGACRDATDRVLRGEDRRALCLVRPPGHHAIRGTRVLSNGFCLFNNVAVAAQRAVAEHGLERVLIIDWDVHHGNGTQDIFEERGDVWYVSLHRSPFFPGTGAPTERGRGEGEGTIFNRPLAYASTDDRSYLEVFRATVEPAFEACDPQLLLISAGFDTLESDPLAGLGVQVDTFTELTRVCADLAGAGRAEGRILTVLEGGYDPAGQAEALARVAEVLLDG